MGTMTHAERIELGRQQARLRLRRRHKLAGYYRKTWKSGHDYRWVLTLLDNEWRYT